MRTLISYSDLPTLPPSILGWGNNGEGLAEKSSSKDDLLGFCSAGGRRVWGGLTPPKTPPKSASFGAEKRVFPPIWRGRGKLLRVEPR